MRQVLSPWRDLCWRRKTLKIKYYETTKKSQKQILLGAHLNFLEKKNITNKKLITMKNYFSLFSFMCIILYYQRTEKKELISFPTSNQKHTVFQKVEKCQWIILGKKQT